MRYLKTMLAGGKWVITEQGHDFRKPAKGITFAFDTETLVYFDNKVVSQRELSRKCRNLKTEERRKRVRNETWAWQAYDEVNGFFMTNDFYEWLNYACLCGYKFGWCYNASFDFAQIDAQVLALGKDKWKPHVKPAKGSHKGYDRGQPWTYESLHNDMGARYAYKLWIPYKSGDRHTYVHSCQYHDFMKIVTGGLASTLEGLDVRDADGNPIRKLEMDYQAVDPDNLTEAEIDYCMVDVKGLFFAVKQFNETMERQSNGESHIYGKDTNIMTAGGFAKAELLRMLYPQKKNKRLRLLAYQKDHPLAVAQDKYIRTHHLYRGGISFVNPHYKGKMLTKEMMGRPMNRYDVNSEYPYSMHEIRDLVGQPKSMTIEEWEAVKDKDEYECAYILESVFGHVKKGMLGLWYDPFQKEYVETIAEAGIHLMFEREFNEMMNWYEDVEAEINNVIVWKRGERVYAPFVEANYELKRQSKKDGNSVLQATAKLLLNSSYGKLSERIERATGHYELNEENGAVHFVTDGEEDSAKSRMNVAVGALVTSFARCYILSKIREVCGDGRVAERFVYIDTDSIHAFADYAKADAYALGGLKLEAQCDAVKYIASKTYVDIEKVNRDGTIDWDAFELHSKGVSISAISLDLRKKQKGKKKGKPTLQLMDAKIAYGARYVCLCSMNVQGGKVLLPLEKFLARWELAPSDEPQFINNMEGCILQER